MTDTAEGVNVYGVRFLAEVVALVNRPLQFTPETDYRVTGGTLGATPRPGAHGLWADFRQPDLDDDFHGRTLLLPPAQLPIRVLVTPGIGTSVAPCAYNMGTTPVLKINRPAAEASASMHSAVDCHGLGSTKDRHWTREEVQQNAPPFVLVTATDGSIQGFYYSEAVPASRLMDPLSDFSAVAGPRHGSSKGPA